MTEHTLRPTPERANAVARAIVREVMDMPEFSMGRDLSLGQAAPVPPGEVPTAWIGSVVDGRPFIHALVGDLEIFVVVEVLALQGETLIFRSLQVKGEDVRDAAAALADWLRGRGDTDPSTVNPLDAVVRLRDALTLSVPSRGGFMIRAHADASRPDQPAMSGVSDAGTGVWVTARPGGGLRIQLAPEERGESRAELEVRTFAELVDAEPRIVESTRHALAARDAFLARPFSVGDATRTLLGALRKAELSSDGRWEESIGHDDYLFPWPRAWIRLREGTSERLIVTLEESSGGVKVSIVDREGAILVVSSEDLLEKVPSLVARAKKLKARLTADALAPGEIYRFLRPVAGFRPGDAIELAEVQYVPYDSVTLYRFVSPSTPGATWGLDERSDADVAILRDLDLYLERVG